MATFYYIPESDSLVHHGIKGQKWGERHYQNKDGTWTAEGKARRRKGQKKKIFNHQTALSNLMDTADLYIRKRPNTSRGSNEALALDAQLEDSAIKYMQYGYPKVYKSKKDAERKVLRGMALGALVGGVSLSLAIPTGGVSAAAGGAFFGGTFGTMYANTLPSVRKASNDFYTTKGLIIETALKDYEHKYKIG